ncbi:hypothetical protein GF420_02935 [candidate division GN15 bacterium]|nr:hypothetical protein [candidate division GN15 bacterium]
MNKQGQGVVQTIQLPHNQELKIWEKITLKVGDGKEAGTYAARIEDFLNGGIVITNPEYVQGRTLMRDGITVTVQITREDAAYEFNSKITQRHNNGTAYAILTPPKQVRRVQRRLFCRIDLSSPAEYVVLEGGKLPTKGEDDKIDWKNSHTFDVSAGGALIQSHDDIRVKDLLLLRLGLFDEVQLASPILAVCRRLVKLETGPAAGVEFVVAYDLPDLLDDSKVKALPPSVRRFSDMAQERLSRHLFDRQIELRNKGLL